jgi:CMP-N,N'-diacetyllegionaminic acid synthase
MANLNNKYLAIITARGGSKGIPKKNIRLLNGKPLIVYTIERALEIKDDLYEVIVSTDDEEIAEISVKAGACVPFLRPLELSTDSASSFDVVKHAVEFIEKERNVVIDWSLILQPTTPLRTSGDIISALNIAEIGDCDTVVSVYDASNSHPGKMKIINKNGKLTPFLSDVPWLARRQDRKPEVYLTNGGIYMTRRDVLMKSKSLIGKSVSPYIMPIERSVDIDSLSDFLLAESILKLEDDNKHNE